MDENLSISASPKSALQARLLGPPESMWSGRLLGIPRRQPRAILYRLAARPEPIPRAHLCLLLWPDIPESEARRNLSNQVYNLRRSLPDGDVIQASGDMLTLDPQRTWSDVAAFDHLSRRSEREALQRAVDLYRGPFLDGFSLADNGEFSLWADRERRFLERRYLETLSTLMTDYAAQGDYEAAIACAQRYLEIDELAEDVHRRLIDIYAAQGDRGAALRQYECCAAVLERELGIDPLPETREIYQAVLEDRPTLAVPLYTPPTWTTLPSLEAPLVGREEAMTQLKAAFAQTRSGIGSAVLVSGEPGVGKSRLLEEFVTEHDSHATLLTGGGYEAQGDIPYLSLIDALGPLLSSVDWDSLNADPTQLAHLLRLIPELREHISELPKPPSTEQEQEEGSIFRGLAHLLLSLAEKYPPLILCLDDLHWTDETTRSWLGYLGRRLGEAPLLLLGGYSTEEARVVQPLRDSLARLNVLKEVRLQGLTVKDVGELIQGLSGQTSGHEHFCRNLQRLTDGNPFFLLEILRSLFEAGSLEQDDTGWHGNVEILGDSFEKLPWPDSVVETVRRRVGKLHPSTTQVLEAGAVIGRRFDLGLVQAASGRSEREVIDALDELAARQLVKTEQGWYEFRHDLIRAIVEEDLSFGRRRHLNRRAGEAMENKDLSNPAALARHFNEAGEVGKAVSYWLQAGDRARQLFAHQEAIEFYRQALAFQEQNGEIEQAARTLMRLGMSYQIAYDYRRAHRAFQKSFDLRRQSFPLPPMDLSPAPHPLRLSLNSTPHPRLLHLDTPRQLDPNSSKPSHMYIKQLFSGLLRSGDNWSIQPEVARTWEVSDDGRRYTFHLRDDAIWSDGEPVTAHDFEFAWKRILTPQTEGDSDKKLHELYTIRGAKDFNGGKVDDPDSVAVRAVDPLTLEVNLEEPAEYFLNLLTYYKLSPVPRHMVERHGKSWTDPGKIVTNGPFCLEEWVPGERVTLARNPTYFGDFRGNLRQVSISNHWLPPDDQLEAYRAGEVDILSLGLETYPARFQHIDEYCQVEAPKTYLLGFGLEENPFHDQRVRLALGLAIDKDDIAQQTLHGFDLPVTGGLLPPGFPGHSAGIGLPYDPSSARRYLTEAGYPDGKGFPRVELLVPEPRLRYAQVLQKHWDRQLGIQVQPKGVAWADFFKRFRQAPLFIVGWTGQFIDPYNFLRVGASYLAEFWQHPGFDRLIRKAARMSDQAQRLSLYREADRILIAEAAVVPLFYRVDHYLVKPWVKINLQPYSLKDVILEPH